MAQLTWLERLSGRTREEAQQLPPGVSEQAASHLLRLTEELGRYQQHGTNDAVLIAQAKILSEALRSKNSRIDYQVAAAYGAVYMRVATTRRELIKDVDKMRAFYLVDVLLTQFTEDSLAPEIGTGNVLEVKSNRPELQAEIDALEEKFDLDALALAICPDLLLYGEYTLKTKVEPHPSINKKKEDDAAQANNPETKPAPANGKLIPVTGPSVEAHLKEVVVPVTGGAGKDGGAPNLVPITGPTADGITNQDANAQKLKENYGLIELEDVVEQGTVVALTHYSQTVGYLSLDQTTHSKKIRKHQPADFVKFSLSGQRIRIDLHKEFQATGTGSGAVPEELKDIPRYIRVGKSVIHPIIAKLKELELLEALVPATKLAKLSSGTVVGVQVPAGYDIQKAAEAARQAEAILNKRVGVDDRLGELTIENIMNTAGRLKVVPIFGDKGQLTKLDYQSDEPDELLASVKETREIICSSAGIPYEILFSTNGEKKGELLKKYARYLRKLKAIQKAIEEGMRQIVYIHLVNKGYEFRNEDITVEFNHKLIEIDNLDNLEFIDATVGLLKNTKDFISSLADPVQSPGFADRVDVSVFVEFLNKQLAIVGFKELIRMKSVDKVGNVIVTKSTAQDPNKGDVSVVDKDPGQKGDDIPTT